MTYRAFKKWCRQRASDGIMTTNMSGAAGSILRIMKETPFWERRNKWKYEMSDTAFQLVREWQRYFCDM